MKIYSEKGLSLDFIDNKVLVRVYPQSNILVEITKSSALYLYHLLNKYNNTIGTMHWNSFWRRVPRVERAILTMFIASNANSHWGEKLYFTNEKDLPQEFLDIKNSKRHPTTTIEIRKELQEIFNVYMKAVVTQEEIKNYWESHYTKTCDILKKNQQFDNLLKVCFESDKIEKILHSVLQKESYNGFDKPEGVDKYNEDILNFLIANEVVLFCSTAFDLAYSKIA